MGIGDDAAVLDVARRRPPRLDDRRAGRGHALPARPRLVARRRVAQLHGRGERRGRDGGRAVVRAVRRWCSPTTSTTRRSRASRRDSRRRPTWWARPWSAATWRAGRVCRSRRRSSGRASARSCAAEPSRATALWMAGRVGLAAAGLRALERGEGSATRPSRRPSPRGGRRGPSCSRGARWRASRTRRSTSPTASRATSGHLAAASGVRAVLDESALLADRRARRGRRARSGPARSTSRSTAARTTRSSPRAPWPIDGFRRVGEVTAGRGVALRGPGGERPIEPRGFDHFGPGRAPGPSAP